ncbi:hypothetical protein TrVGV298_009877 [Trichoderma virens]|nr:hypothetical protein TrVGV298_009877 [Trichoderma virens]
MEAFDGLVKFYPEYALHLRNESFLTGHPLDRFPTTENILKGTLIDSNDGSGILPYPSILNLYGNGCRSYPTNEINCTAVCADERDLFVDWQTQWNCLTLSNMAINKPYPHNYNNSNNAGDTARILNQLGVTNLTAFDSIGVLKRYIACANETWFPSWDSYLPEWEALVETSQHLNLHELGVAFSHICDEGIFQISSDIAGPGNNSKMRATGLAHMIQFGLLLTSIFIFIVEIISIVLMAINLLPLYGLWMYMYSGSFRHSGNDTWSISQIISVLVWAPVLSRYFYLLVFGVERGFAIRLSKAFAVIRKQKQPTGLEDQTDKDGHPNFRSTTAEIAV